MLHAEMEKWMGLVAISLTALAFTIKGLNVLSYVTCPLKMLWFKKKIRNF